MSTMHTSVHEGEGTCDEEAGLQPMVRFIGEMHVGKASTACAVVTTRTTKTGENQVLNES